jgi:subtilisin-like proprotein convertase family protein
MSATASSGPAVPRLRSFAAAGLAASLALLGVVAVPVVSGHNASYMSTPNIAIPDDGYNGTLLSMATNTIVSSSIPAGYVVTGVGVTVGINHSWAGDLTIKLRSPGGAILALLDRPKGDDASNNTGDNGTDSPLGDNSNLSSSYALQFHDAYVQMPEDMGAGINTSQSVCQDDSRCYFAPDPDQALVAASSVASFADFNGELAHGSWTLGVGDSANVGEFGTLVSWGLSIDYQMGRSVTYSSTPGMTIPDNTYTGNMATMATNSIDTSGTIPASHVVTSVSVTIGITHTFVGDLTIKLRSPVGFVLALMERPKGDDATNNHGDNGTDLPAGDSSDVNAGSQLTFSDSFATNPEDVGLGIGATQIVCQDDGRCQLMPNSDDAIGSLSNLGSFDGDLASGVWTLGVGDGGNTGDVGTFVSWKLTIRHALPLTSCAGSPFSDVPNSNAFCSEIQWMRDNEVSSGFGDGTYRPGLAVTRQAMAAFMARTYGATLSPCATAPFTDVATTHPFCPEIKWMLTAGISTGFGDGTYRPSLAVSRQAMAAFISRLADLATPPCSAPPFPDVPVTHPFCAEINAVKDAGISTGFGDGTYRPALAVARQAMSAFMYRTGLQIP